jgi:acylphosphatase
MSLVARRLSVRGVVQGVGYRQAMVSAAEAAGVRGWVRNRRDGTVEAVVQGEGSAVLAVVAWCERGPTAARVDAVEVTDVPLDDTLSGFELRASG